MLPLPEKAVVHPMASGTFVAAFRSVVLLVGYWYSPILLLCYGRVGRSAATICTGELFLYIAKGFLRFHHRSIVLGWV